MDSRKYRLQRTSPVLHLLRLAPPIHTHAPRFGREDTAQYKFCAYYVTYFIITALSSALYYIGDNIITTVGGRVVFIPKHSAGDPLATSRAQCPQVFGFIGYRRCASISPLSLEVARSFLAKRSGAQAWSQVFTPFHYIFSM